MATGLNYTKFLDYAARFEQTQLKAKPFAKQFLNEQGQTLRALTVSETPTVTSVLKNRWRLSGVTESVRGLRIIISNNVEYASFVEYGHRTRKRKDGSRRWVNGRFMLTRAQAHVSARLQREFTRACYKFFRENGVT